MQVKRIQHYIDQYQTWLQSSRADERLHLWATQRIFQEHWDIEALDFAAMYDTSLQNPETRRLWKREHYEPKRLMQLFIAMEPEYVRHVFRDLFNEDKDIENRVDRFAFYCEDMLHSYRDKNPLSIENHPYHDAAMISLYLALRYPANYCYYDGPAFTQLMQKLGAASIPQADDLGRYFKTARILFGFLQKNEAVMALHQKRLQPKHHYVEESLLIVWDFACYCTLPDQARVEFV